MRHWPFGAERSGTAPERGYTGQQKEPLLPLGMYYYKARFYSAATAHFVSADSNGTDGLDRYTYVENNPVRYVDPTGECFTFTWRDAEGREHSTQFECVNEEGRYDTADWLECALSCSGWVQLVALYGLRQQEFWSNVFNATDPRTITEVMISLMTSIADERSRFHLVPDYAWYSLSAWFNVQPAFFRLSVWGLLFGSVPGGIPGGISRASESLIGAHPWWENEAFFGGILANTGTNAYDRFLETFSQGNAAKVVEWIDTMTINWASTVTRAEMSAPRAWSDHQMRVLADAGYKPRKKALDFRAIWDGCSKNYRGCGAGYSGFPTR